MMMVSFSLELHNDYNVEITQLPCALFFFCKNLFYKYIAAAINQNVKVKNVFILLICVLNHKQKIKLTKHEINPNT